MVKKSGDTMTGRLRFVPMTGDEGVVEVRTDSTETVTVRDIYEYVRLIALKSVADQHNVADVDVRYQKNGDIALYNQLTRKVNGNSLFATLALSISNGGFRSLIASGLDAVSLPSGDAVKFNGKSLTEIIAAIKTLTVKVVDALPATGEDKTIYLVPNGGAGTNVKDEYLWVDGRWEKIGTTDVDLSQYAKKEEVESVSDRVDEAFGELGVVADDIEELDGRVTSAEEKATTASGTALSANQKAISAIEGLDGKLDKSGGSLSGPLTIGSVTITDTGVVFQGKEIYWSKGGEVAMADDLAYSINTSGTILNRAMNYFVADGTALTLRPPSAIEGKIRDFVLRIDCTETTTIDWSAFGNCETTGGKSWSDMMLVESGKSYVYRFTDMGGDHLCAAREEVS
ncbi:MAG: hypothetical protein MJZ81_07575 [Bacteroidales bacterium]|nr:hypothetical protein [Bacteroidales bacterium]